MPDRRAPVAEVGITGQHCWGPKDGVAFEPKAFSLTEPGVHSIYAGALVGGATPDLSLSLSYSVTIGCGEWYSLTQQLCAPVNQVPPSISGTSAVGQTVTANPGTWASGDEGPDFDMIYRYEWQRCATSEASSCRQASGAGGPSYVVTDADRGSRLSVQVRAWNSRAGSPPAAADLVGPVT